MEVTVSAPEKQHTLWASLVEAVRGSHQDYTTGSLNRAILLLAVPMVLEMVLESLFAVVDIFWVGRLGANATATVGLTETMLSLVFSVGFGYGRSNGVDAEFDIRRSDGAEPVDHRHGGAAYR